MTLIQFLMAFLLPTFLPMALSTGPYQLNLLGLYPMTGSKWPGGQAMLPASQLAVTHINANASILDGYQLNIVAKDTQVICI